MSLEFTAAYRRRSNVSAQRARCSNPANWRARTPRILILLFVCSLAGPAWASDACSTRAITTAADVTVSDGSSFKTESFYHSRDAAAIRHIRDSSQVIAVEGPLGWVAAGDQSQLGNDFHKLFALGHQYHAFVLHFEEVTDNQRTTENLRYQGGELRALSGDYPYGGVVHRVEGEDGGHPIGLSFEFPGRPPIEVALSDWRSVDGVELPFLAEIDDGERVFDYRYTNVEIDSRSPLWFFETLPAPELDELQIYRLHRTQLAAHCLGDADLMATTLRMRSFRRTEAR